MSDPPRLLDRVRARIRVRHGQQEDIRTIPELLGHADVKTTMIDTRVLQQTGDRDVRGPMEKLVMGERE